MLHQKRQIQFAVLLRPDQAVSVCFTIAFQLVFFSNDLQFVLLH
jgi:hypothetical protein